jgi:uncharacterized membrane protein
VSRRRTQGRATPRRKPSAKLDRAEREAAERAHEVTQRAIKRLDVLEWFAWGAGAIMAMVAGGVVAWVMGGLVGWSFRPTWMVASMLLFVIPGGAAIIKIRKDERAETNRNSNDG